MTHRRCGTCKHFEQAPIFRKGWCRNPLLYSPQQSHLVSDEDLDCERGMGNYWEPSDDYVMTHTRAFSDRTASREAPDDDATTAGDSAQLRSSRGVPIYPVSGSSGYGSEPPPPAGSDPGGGWGGDDRNQFGYYEEERYWTDYLRIVLPLLGVILLVVVLWFWIANALDDDDDDNGDIAGDATSTETIPTVGDDTSPTEPAAGTEAPPGTAEAPTPTSPPDNGGEEPAGTEPPANGGEPTGLYNGAIAEIANTGGTGVNVRADATTSAEILNVYLDGTQVEIIGDPVEAEGFTWWPITGEAVEMGWIVQEYLALIE